MGNSKSHPEQEFSSRFLPGEQAEVNRLFDALSSENLGSSTSHRSFSLQALKGHVGDALPPEMVTRLFEGMQRVDGSRKAKGPSEHISQKQFTVSMSHLLKGTAEEKSLVILNMISASGGPVKARDVYKFTEDLVGSVVHVLNYRQELRGWSQKPPPGSLSRVQLLAAQLCSEMKLQGGGKLLGPQWLDCDCDEAVLEDWVFRAHHVATFLSLIIHQGFLLLCSTLELATLVPERQVDPQREFASLLDVLSVIYINSHLPQERRLRWRLLFATELHGNSFAQLCGRITHKGPCLVLLEDCDGHVFGGFASCSWEVKPQFQGDNRCFLFSVSPSMAVYTCTGYNDHYMYLNQGRQTIPNGLTPHGSSQGPAGRNSGCTQGPRTQGWPALPTGSPGTASVSGTGGPATPHSFHRKMVGLPEAWGGCWGARLGLRPGRVCLGPGGPQWSLRVAFSVGTAGRPSGLQVSRVPVTQALLQPLVGLHTPRPGQHVRG